jgi:selenocysteine-specific elongation factor
MLQGSKLVNRQRVRFHHAAAEILARAVLLDAERLGPGGAGMVQLRLERPTAAMRGDRFVLRTYSPMRVLAGGRVLDPAAPKTKRFRKERLSLLAALDSGDRSRILEALASSAGADGVDPAGLARYGLDPAEAAETGRALASGGVLVEGGGRLFHAGAVSRGESTVLAELEGFAAGNELAWGIDREELRARAGLSGSPLYDLILEMDREAGKIFFRNGKIRAGSDELELSGEMKELIGRLGGRISEAGWTFPSRADLLPLAGRDDRRMLSCLRILQEEGSIRRIGDEGWISAGAIDEVIERAGSIISEKGSMSVGDFKEELGVSRKYAVPLLEYLDVEGYTRREGDTRVAGPSMKGAGR